MTLKHLELGHPLLSQEENSITQQDEKGYSKKIIEIEAEEEKREDKTEDKITGSHIAVEINEIHLFDNKIL